MSLGLVAAAGCCSGLLLLTLEAARRERATVRDWDVAPTPKGERTYTAFESSVRDMAQLVDATLAHALMLYRAGRVDEGQRVLTIAHKQLTLFVADMLGLHAGMADFSRSAAALHGVPGLPARHLRTSRLVWRAHLCNLVQSFLVTPGERFRLRLVTLRNGLLLVNAIVSREHERRRRPRKGGLAADWKPLEAARADLQTLTGEALASLHVLLVALGAQARVPARILAEEPRS